MFERTRPVADPVTIRFDRREVVAERGEPLAVALLAAGETTLARSPKLHRPRGPACMRGDCDGCLARVDGVPNVMTCLRTAGGGEEIGTQNVLGSRKTDLLRLTDWFFPRGIDHHHLMAGVPAVGTLMQTFARQMAGIGRLPEATEAPHAARRIEADVLIVGAGLAGLACAAALAKAGRKGIVVVDEQPALGGSARWLASEAVEKRISLLGANVSRLTSTTMVGYYDKTALLVSEGAAVVASPRALVLATGAHDGVLLTEGNDTPGVMGARALVSLASRGIVPREPAVLIGSGPWSDAASALLGARVKA
ncbi:MAG: (2Fe-2S)-binding protein, partial [Myxococcales bacterium]|nr:(2Fe-2S)-binding protein [Myxococcales bacterium]